MPPTYHLILPTIIYFFEWQETKSYVYCGKVFPLQNKDGKIKLLSSDEKDAILKDYFKVTCNDCLSRYIEKVTPYCSLDGDWDL